MTYALPITDDLGRKFASATEHNAAINAELMAIKSAVIAAASDPAVAAGIITDVEGLVDDAQDAAAQADAAKVVAQAFGVPFFASRAAVIAATIPAPVINFSYLHDGKRIDVAEEPTAGTSITTNGGTRRWSPAGEATPQHWGAVADGVDTLAGWVVNRRVWATATAYAVNDLLWVNKIGYRCVTAHTSAAAFATDLAAGRWVAGAFTGTDATAAFAAALAWCGPRRQSLHLHDGDAFRFAHQSLQNNGYINLSAQSYVSIVCDGNADLLIDEDPVWFDGSTGGKDAVFLFDSGVVTTGNRTLREKFECRNIRFRGRWSHNVAKTGVNGIRAEGFREFIFDGGGGTDIRNKITRCGSNGSFRVTNTFSERCARGFWRSRDTDNFHVVGNFMRDGDDDGIDCHSTDANGLSLPRSRAFIVNNTLMNCEGIVCLGLKMGIVTGNVLRFTHGSGIVAGSGVNPEGNTPPLMLDVSGNIVADALERYDAGAFSAPNANQGSIYVAGSAKSGVSTGGVIPGRYDAGTQSIRPIYTDAFTTQPWGALWSVDTFDEGSDATVYSSPGGYGFTVNRNQVMRTAPNLDFFSEGGVGFLFNGTDGLLDPAVDVNAFKANGIILLGDMTDFAVQNNIVRGVSNGCIHFRGASALDRKRAFRNGIVANNMLSDCLYGISKDGVSGSPAFADYDDWDISFIGNKIDVDPRHVATVRTTPINGTWQSTSSLIYSGILWRHAKNARFVQNEFRNCFRPIQGNNSENTQFSLQGNLVRCNPTAIAWNAANIGVAVPERAGPGFTHIIEDGDPRNASEGALLNTCPMSASAVPTAGTFVQGHFVENTNPTVASGKITQGWRRLTTGTAHVNNAAGSGDWVPVVVTTS